MDPKIQHEEKHSELNPLNTEFDQKENSVSDSASTINKEKIKAFFKQCSHTSKNALDRSVEFCKEKKREIRHYALVVAGVLAIVILFQNIESAQIEFLFWGFQAPKIILFATMLVIGAVFGYWFRGKKMNSNKWRNVDTGQSVH